MGLAWRFVFVIAFSSLCFSSRSHMTRASNCNSLEIMVEFHSEPVCTDPVQNFPMCPETPTSHVFSPRKWKRSATGVFEALRARSVPGVSPRVSPKTGGVRGSVPCTGCLQGPSGPRLGSVQKVSGERPWIVKRHSGVANGAAPYRSAKHSTPEKCSGECLERCRPETGCSGKCSGKCLPLASFLEQGGRALPRALSRAPRFWPAPLRALSRALFGGWGFSASVGGRPVRNSGDTFWTLPSRGPEWPQKASGLKDSCCSRPGCSQQKSNGLQVETISEASRK